MSDFKFECPNCGQHLSGDVRYAGQQIACPACSSQIIVPAAPPAAVAPIVRPVPTTRSQPAVHPPPPPSAGKTCGLAVVSLICSIGSFIILPLGFIPGIICGHLAKKKIARTPGLLGNGLAKAGLIIGYIALGLNVLVVLAVIGFFVLFAAHVQQLGPITQSDRPVMTPQAGDTPPAQGETTDTEPDGSGWTMKLTDVKTPSGPAAGRIHGRSFKTEKVTLENGFLTFAQGKDFFADLEMDVVVFENDPAKLSGRTFTVPKAEFGINPHIWIKWKQPGRDLPEQRNFMERYALRLEFGGLSGGQLPGKIYLCLPDQEKSFIAGTFTAPVKEAK